MTIKLEAWRAARAAVLTLLGAGLTLLLFGAVAGAQEVEPEDPPPTQQPLSAVVLPAQVEVEAYDRGGPDVAYFDTDEALGNRRLDEAVDVFSIHNAGASGDLIGRTRDGEWVEYTVEVTASDEFEVRLRLASGATDPGVIHVDVDGARIGTADGDTERWFDWTLRSAGTVALDPGSHVVRLTWDEGANVNLDWFELRSTTASTAVTCDTGVQEAENAELSGRFEIVTDQDASDTGYVTVPRGSGGYWRGKSDSYVEFCFGVSEAGAYRIDTRLRAPTAKDSSFFVSVDDGPAASYVADVTEGLFATDTVNDAAALDPLRSELLDDPIIDPLVYDLAPGDHTVRFYLRRDGAELDAVRLVAADAPATPLEQSRRVLLPDLVLEIPPEDLDEAGQQIRIFSAAAGDIMYLTTSEVPGATLTVQAPDGSVIASGDSATLLAERIVLPVDGEYSVVYDAGTSEPTTVRVRIQLNPSSESVSVYRDTTNVYRSFAPDFDVDGVSVWRGTFDVRAGEIVYVFRAETSGGRWRLYGPDGQQLALGEQEEALTFEVGGTYSLEYANVSRYRAFGIDYRVQALPTPIPLALDELYEMGVDIRDINYSTWLGEFDAAAGDVIYVRQDFAFEDDVLRLLGPDGQAIDLPSEDWLPIELPVAGTYTLQLFNLTFFAGLGDFRVEPQDVVAVEIGTLYEITSEPLDVWVGQFEATEGETLYGLPRSGAGPGTIRWYVYAPDGTEVFERDRYVVSQTGTYTIQAAASSYPFPQRTYARVQRDIEAVPIEIGVVTTVVLDIGEVWFGVFDGNAGDLVNLQVTNFGPWRFYGPDGQEQNLYPDAGVELTLEATGTQMVVVNNLFNSPGLSGDLLVEFPTP